VNKCCFVSWSFKLVEKSSSLNDKEALYGWRRQEQLSLFPSMDQHDKTVAEISASVHHFYKLKKPFRIYHGSTSSTRPSTKHRDQVVDTSSLTHILGINAAAQTVLVEPNVSMARLVEYTTQHGYVPLVVMEFPAITVGGGFSGSSGESSSFRHGLFEDTVSSIEIVLGNGELVKASNEENTELLHAAAGSFGTMGVVTLLEVQLRPARKFVKLSYTWVYNVEEAIQAIENAMADSDVDYWDSVFFSLGRGVVMSGQLTDRSDGYKICRFSRAIDEWFYLHVQTKSESTSSDVIPLEDYLFRYDRGAFWMGKHGFDYFGLPFNRFTRFLLDYFARSGLSYKALHSSGLSHRFFIQDIAFPCDTTAEFTEYIDEVFGYYPIWFCPVRPKHPSLMIPSNSSSLKRNPGLFMDIGIWAPGPDDDAKFIKLNRDIEAMTYKLRGNKILYAQAFYTKDEFWNIYPKERYDQLRKKYHANTLPDIYDKTKLDFEARKRATTGFLSRRPWAGIYGVMDAAFEKDVLIARTRPSKGWSFLVFLNCAYSFWGSIHQMSLSVRICHAASSHVRISPMQLLLCHKSN
jgi:delta24-sterol reductase